jgi:hypothetical protein
MVAYTVCERAHANWCAYLLLKYSGSVRRQKLYAELSLSVSFSRRCDIIQITFSV